MSSNYKLYLKYLASIAENQSMVREAEEKLYPLFSELKRLINHYSETIVKFDNVQDELVRFVESLKYDDYDFEYYKEKFQELFEVDKYLQELSDKQVPTLMAAEMRKFVDDTYNDTSLYIDIKKVEDEVLAKINKTYEIARVNKPSGCAITILIFIASITILSFTI